MAERAPDASWVRGEVRLRSHVDGPLTFVSIEGALTLDDDAHFARRVHELAEFNNADAAVVDFRHCAVLFGAVEAADALAPVFAGQETMPRPIAMICLPKDFERFDDFASKAGYSRAVRRAFTDFDAAVAWSTQKGKVWRARRIEARRQAQAA
jgi:hypothetical protein